MSRGACAGGLEDGAARHQTAHAVAEYHQFFHRHRPLSEQLLEQLREVASIFRDVAAAVVVQVNRRESEIARQRLAVVMAVALPLQVVHA